MSVKQDWLPKVSLLSEENSATDVLVPLTETLQSKLSQKANYIAALLDLSKAFFSIHHSILLDKISQPGF